MSRPTPIRAEMLWVSSSTAVRAARAPVQAVHSLRRRRAPSSRPGAARAGAPAPGLRHGGRGRRGWSGRGTARGSRPPPLPGRVATPGEGPGEGVGPAGAQGGAPAPPPTAGRRRPTARPGAGPPQVVQPGGVVVEQGVAVAQVEVAQPARVGLPRPRAPPPRRRSAPGGWGRPRCRSRAGPGAPRARPRRPGRSPAPSRASQPALAALLPHPRPAGRVAGTSRPCQGRRCRHPGVGGGVRRGAATERAVAGRYRPLPLPVVDPGARETRALAASLLTRTTDQRRWPPAPGPPALVAPGGAPRLVGLRAAAGAAGHRPGLAASTSPT